MIMWGEESLGSADLFLVNGADPTDRDLINNEYANKTPIDVSDYNSIKFSLSGAEESLTANYELYNFYTTGDNLDGNTDTKDGGTFNIGYTVLCDDVLIEVATQDYFNPQRVKANVPNWTSTEEGYEANEADVTVPSTPADSSIIDITDAEVLKTALDRTGTHYTTILTNTHDEICFPSVPFEVTMLNNLRLDVGQPVAICTGVAPTRFSYIDKINTDLFGTTTISNTRGGE